MGQIWVKGFTGGLDARRLPETVSGAVLVKATDGHLDSGGQFRKRAAFVEEYSLPEGTVGLARDSKSIVVFGTGEEPDGMPTGVRYQQIQHPADSTIELVRVLASDMYSGLPYVVAEYADGGVYHYYDGELVLDFEDGRARIGFTVDSGSYNDATAATSTLTVTAGTSGIGNQVDSVTVDSTVITSYAVPAPVEGTLAALAEDLAESINAATDTTGYSATASGAEVTVSAPVGVAYDGLTVTVSVSGDVAVSATDTSGGTDASTSSLSDLTVDGVSVIQSAVEWAGSAEDTAAAIVSAINSYTSDPDYSASQYGTRVNVLAGDVGSTLNDAVVVATTADGLTLSAADDWTMSGGNDSIENVQATNTAQVTAGTEGDTIVLSITYTDDDGVEQTVVIDGGEVTWTSSNADTASAIVTAIEAEYTTPNFGAEIDEDDDTLVIITAEDYGSAANSYTLSVEVSGDAAVTLGATLFSGGQDSEYYYVPGRFAKTIKSRVHVTSGATEIFSGIGEPTHFTTEYTGAGFIDMSQQASGSENLASLAVYQSWVAVFAEQVTQIWYFDSDPDDNAIQQILNNTGTQSPRSVTQFGDSDLFYLDESGIRSLKARDSSNAAATSDIGVPIDTLVKAKVGAMSAEDRERYIMGLIEPLGGRFWLIVKDEIFVFSYFAGSKISAWSTYEPGFDIEYAQVFKRKVHVRSGDSVYVYGGLGTDQVFGDDYQAIGKTAFLDGGGPATKKKFFSVDVACRGRWESDVYLNPDVDAGEVGAQGPLFTGTTYAEPKVPLEFESTHICFEFTSQGAEESILSALLIQHDMEPESEN